MDYTYEEFENRFIDVLRFFLMRKMSSTRYHFDTESWEILCTLNDVLQGDTGIEIADNKQYLIANWIAARHVETCEWQVTVIIYRSRPVLCNNKKNPIFTNHINQRFPTILFTFSTKRVFVCFHVILLAGLTLMKMFESVINYWNIFLECIDFR